MSSWWIEVDGFVLPQPIGGHPALELCNTRSGWDEPYRANQEYLASYAHLVVLARETGVLPPTRAGVLLDGSRRASAGRDDELARAHRLRADCRAALTGNGSAAAYRRVERAASEARSRQVLVREAQGHRWAWPGAPTLAEPLDALLLAVADLLVSADLGRVRACPRSDCGWLFLDATGRRRWCQMGVCGNRAKQDRLRQRG